MSDDVLVRVDNVSKRFCRSLKRSLWYGLQDLGSEIGGRRHVGGGGLPQSSADVELRKDEFWAVKDVSFELRRGECLGLIGRNGAGKTTLLRMLNGLIKPDSGSIAIRGRAGALIALGAGFNPILTGRENIYTNGAIIGLSNREIKNKLEEIIEFAEIGDFIDTPTQNYSSGMSVRLGFAVASMMQPDVLFVDEVLAVGDTSFKVKCYNKIRDLLTSSAVVLVSHSMHDIARACTSVLMLERGSEHFIGEVQRGIQVYNSLNCSTNTQTGNPYVVHLSEYVERADVESFETGTKGLSSWLSLGLTVACHKPIVNPRIRIVIHDDSIGESAVAEWDSKLHNVSYSLDAGINQLRIELQDIRLRSGNYRVLPVICDEKAQGYHLIIEHGLMINIQNLSLAGAPYKI